MPVNPQRSWSRRAQPPRDHALVRTTKPEAPPGYATMVPAFLEINCLFSGTSVASVADIEAGLSPTARVARGQQKDLVMGKAQLHVVFGTGQVGNALAAHLAGLGVAVRAVSRPRPAELAGVPPGRLRTSSARASPRGQLPPQPPGEGPRDV